MNELVTIHNPVYNRDSKIEKCLINLFKIFWKGKFSPDVIAAHDDRFILTFTLAEYKRLEYYAALYVLNHINSTSFNLDYDKSVNNLSDFLEVKAKRHIYFNKGLLVDDDFIRGMDSFDKMIMLRTDSEYSDDVAFNIDLTFRMSDLSDFEKYLDETIEKFDTPETPKLTFKVKGGLTFK